MYGLDLECRVLCPARLSSIEWPPPYISLTLTTTRAFVADLSVAQPPSEISHTYP